MFPPPEDQFLDEFDVKFDEKKTESKCQDEEKRTEECEGREKAENGGIYETMVSLGQELAEWLLG